MTLDLNIIYYPTALISGVTLFAEQNQSKIINSYSVSVFFRAQVDFSLRLTFLTERTLCCVGKDSFLLQGVSIIATNESGMCGHEDILLFHINLR